MGTLSNFLRRTDAAATARPAPAVEYRPARREQIHPGLRIVLGQGGRPADEGAVVDFLQFATQRGIDLDNLWLAEQSGRVIWATLPLVSPGRTMLLLAPGGRPRPDGNGDVAGTLIDTVCGHFAQRGVQLAQTLADPSDGVARELLLDHSFSEVAELLYLQVDLHRALPPPKLPEGFDWVIYSTDSHAVFAQTIAKTYRDSLDCPALNGLRDIEDVIAGHKGSGGGIKSFNPSWWFLLRERGEPLAVLLLAPTAASHVAAELVYLGLVPAARGKGIGDLLMRQALHVVSGADGGGGGGGGGGNARTSIALAVDSHNAPALRLYHRHGMRRVGSKRAFVRQLRGEREAAAAAPAPVVHDPSTRPVIS